MLKKMICMLLALLLCGGAMAEEITVLSDEVVEAIPEAANEALSADALAQSAPDEALLADPAEAAPEPERTDAGDIDDDNAGLTLRLSATKLTIGVGEKCDRLTATLTGSDQAVTWSSDDKKIVKVNAKTGLLTGVATGTTIVRASAAGLVKQCKVTVGNAPEKVTLSKTALTLSVGQTFALKATLPSGTGSTLTYSTNRKKVAAVDAITGAITALVPGTATIKVTTFNGKKATCKVTVTAEPDQVFLPESLTIAVNQTRTVVASVVDSDGNNTVADCVYSAIDGTGSVDVDAKTGKVTGVRTGTAFIRVETHNGVTSHVEGDQRVESVCAVTVVDGPDKVRLAASSVTIGVNQTYALKPEILAPDGSAMPDAAYTVTSSAPKKLTVSAAGVIKGVGKGTYTVTVTAYNGVSAACKVKVVAAPSKVSLSPAKPTVGIGQTAKLKVSFPKGTMASCTFSSSAKAVVSVDGEGNVTGLKEGSAVVKVRTHNGKTAKVTVKVVKGPDFITLNGEYELEYDELSESYRTVYKKTLSVGDTFQIQYENEYATAGSISGYDSDDRDVAEVSAKGLVTAKEPGTANITVYSTSGATATLRVTVPGTPPAKIAFAGEASLPVGRTVAAPALKGTHIDAATLSGALYESGNTKIFTVSWNEDTDRWELTGLKAGTATLRATAGEAVAQVKVKVIKAVQPTAIFFEDALVYMRSGEYLIPRVVDEYGDAVAATVASDDETIAAVSDEGVVTALSEGATTLTATCDGLSATMTVVVLGEAATLTLDADSLTLGVGQRHALIARANGDGGSAGLTYATSMASVATVSASGLVIARGEGMATITVSDAAGASASCIVTVRPAPTLISVTPGSVSQRLSMGGVQLQWAFGASDQVGAVSFASADPAVATVGDEGYVTFVSVGTTTVSAVTHNGLSAQVGVTVLPDREETDATVYRIFAAYSYFNSSYGAEYLPFSRNNAKSITGVFSKSSLDGQGYSTKVMGNPSKTQLLSGISTYFANADDNDVSIVYLCSHGHNTKSSYRNYHLSLPGYSKNKKNANYTITSAEIFNCVKRIRGSVVLILDSCYSGTFLQDMSGRLDDMGGRIAVLTAASNSRATFYNVKNTNKSVDFFTFFLLQGLGYSEKDGWWTGNASGGKGSYPGYLAADRTGNNDGVVTLGEFYDFASKCIAKNIPSYMKKSWYWGEKGVVQAPRFYAGNLKSLRIYQPE